MRLKCATTIGERCEGITKAIYNFLEIVMFVFKVVIFMKCVTTVCEIYEVIIMAIYNFLEIVFCLK